ncbi:MAG: hypothetical protein IKJ67_03960 [Bacteroidales bacterium]|nr:hypothetical protein [Bacteroidales bacterium]
MMRYKKPILQLFLLSIMATILHSSCSKGISCRCENQITHEVSEVYITGGQCADLSTESEGRVIEDCIEL